MKIKFIDSRIQKYILGLEDREQAKALRLLDVLRDFGYKLSPPYSKKIFGDIFELRASGIMKIRILYAFRDGEALILHAFIKKTQKIPRKEIDIALHRLRIFDKI